MAGLLPDAEFERALSRLSGWSHDGNAIKKQYQFQDFRAAMRFMNAVADVADQMDHHPEWCNVYNRVTVTLSTHDAGGVTDKDITLADAMERAAG